MKKVRIDHYIFDHFSIGTLDDIQRIIMAGQVLNNNQPIYKSSDKINPDTADIRLKNIKSFVSRGGLKLKYALENFSINMKDQVMVDIGSSTGGFTDCSLQNGARHVYAVDVGTNQLDYKLRVDPRVTVMEKTNFKNTSLLDFNEVPNVFTIDVSFTSIVPILRHINALFSHDYEIIALIKPQFESYLEETEKNGVITNLETHDKVIQRVFSECDHLNLHAYNIARSPITGTKGNTEYLLQLKSYSYDDSLHIKDIQSIIFD